MPRLIRPTRYLPWYIRHKAFSREHRWRSRAAARRCHESVPALPYGRGLGWGRSASSSWSPSRWWCGPIASTGLLRRLLRFGREWSSSLQKKLLLVFSTTYCFSLFILIWRACSSTLIFPAILPLLSCKVTSTIPNIPSLSMLPTKRNRHCIVTVFQYFHWYPGS